MRHQILVDSRDRNFQKYPRPNGYRVRLPRTYRHVVSARLVSAEIPSSFLVFSEAMRNTSMVVIVNQTSKVVTIPDGNYDAQSLACEVTMALQTAFSDHTFGAEVDALTMAFKMSCEPSTRDVVAEAVSHSRQYVAWGVDTTNNVERGDTDWGLAYYLGFPKGVVTDSVDGVVVSPGVVVTNPLTYVVLDIDELSGVDEGGMYGAAVGRGCFAKIPLSGGSFEHVFRDAESATAAVDMKPTVPKLETLTLTFRSHAGHVLDFRGVEHSFVLELETKDPAPLTGVSGVSGVSKTPPLPPAAVAAAVATPAAAPVVPRPVVAGLSPTHPPPASRFTLKKAAMGGVVLVALGAGGWWVWTKRTKN